MSCNGITRRIDELGRIVIPKEIRYNLGIKDRDLLDIFVEKDGLYIKKFSEISNNKELSDNLCNIFSEVLNIDVMISDRDKIISTSNKLVNVINTRLGNNHIRLINNSEYYESMNSEIMFNITGYFTILPIITSMGVTGLIIIIASNKNDLNMKYAKLLSNLLVNKLDIAS